MVDEEVRFGCNDMSESRNNGDNSSTLEAENFALRLSSNIIPLSSLLQDEGSSSILMPTFYRFLQTDSQVVENALNQSSYDSGGVPDDDHCSNISSENLSTNDDSDQMQESCEVEEDEDIDQAFDNGDDSVEEDEDMDQMVNDGDDVIPSSDNDNVDEDEISRSSSEDNCLNLENSNGEDSEDLKCWKFLYNEIPDNMKTTKVLQKLFIK